MKINIVFTILFLVISSNSLNCYEFIQVEKIFKKVKKNEIKIEELNYDLINCLYLDISLITKVKTSSSFSIRSDQISKFTIDERDKDVRSLCFRYDSIKDVIVGNDEKLMNHLKTKFGITLGQYKIQNPILVLEKRAFVQFEGNGGGTYAFVFDLIDSQLIRIELAYIITH